MKVDYLYETYKKDIYYFLYHLAKRKDIAEELTSEVFVTVVTALPTFRGESDIKTWLFGIARLKWFEWIRREKRAQGVCERLSHYISETEHLDEEALFNKEMIERVQTLIEGEPERARSIVRMRVEGFSFYEIGGEIGISESSARVIDFRTRKKLREQLIKEGYVYE